MPKPWGKHLGVQQDMEDLLAAEASHRGVAERFQGAGGLCTLILASCPARLAS